MCLKENVFFQLMSSLIFHIIFLLHIGGEAAYKTGAGERGGETEVFSNVNTITIIVIIVMIVIIVIMVAIVIIVIIVINIT